MRYGITRPTKVQANVLSLVLFQLDTLKVKLQLWTCTVLDHTHYNFLKFDWCINSFIFP